MSDAAPVTVSAIISHLAMAAKRMLARDARLRVIVAK